MAALRKPLIPHKLERFLQTIARRRSMDSIEVALFVFFDGDIMLGEGNALPSRMVGREGIGGCISTLMGALGVGGSVRYLGYFDTGRLRRYNFAVDFEERPKLAQGYSWTDVSRAVDFLNRKEAKIVMGSFERPQALRQMFIW